jgi:hypothetical protein
MACIAGTLRPVEIAFAVLMTAFVLGLWGWSLYRHRRQGGMFDWARPRFALLELPRSCSRTRDLIYRGLLDALGTRAPRRRKHRDDFSIPSHLDGFGPGSARFRFQLEPLDGERTRLTVSLQSQSANGQAPPDPDEIPARIEQLDRLAGWLAEHGDGRVLETGWGKP